MRRFHCVQKVLVFVLVLSGIYLSALSAEQAMEDVRLYDTGGVEDEELWTPIYDTDHRFSSSEHIVVENEFFRVTYPILRKDQKAGHSYFVKVKGLWMRVTGEGYGDYTYFIDSVRTLPYKINIVKNIPDEITLSYTYHHKNYRADDALSWAYKGEMLLTKVMTLKKGYPGVFVKLTSLPPNPKGEREIGFGAYSPLVFSERVISQHPLDGRHVDLAMGEAVHPYAVSLPVADSFYRILVLSRPMPSYSYQFAPDRGGMLTVNRLLEHADDKYQVFLGAIPFDSRQSLLEMEAFGEDGAFLKQNRSASEGGVLRMDVNGLNRSEFPLYVSASGEYRIVLRARGLAPSTRFVSQCDKGSPKQFMRSYVEEFEYFVLEEQRFFSAGSHSLKIVLEDGSLELDNLSVLPIMSEDVFPLNIVRKVAPHFPALPSHFEGEELSRQTGRGRADATASKGSARVAFGEQDAPGFLTFGPYLKVQVPGEYVARFHMKVRDRIAEDVAIVEVVSGAKVFAQTVLKGDDFSEALRYQTFDLQVEIPNILPQELYKLEFRVYFAATTDLWVDVVEFFPVVE